MDFSALLQQGNAWFYVPSAILLGALHGLEPGHSKTMMASFIVAIRGTVKQAVMLGVAATLSHTLIVWLIAIGGMYISQELTAESAEPWIQLISGIIVFGLTGGLIPCPAAVTVLLLCLQLKEIALGATMVLCFSIGLAITLVSVGVIAAIGTRKATFKFSKLNVLAQKAPYLSGLLICAVGFYIS